MGFLEFLLGSDVVDALSGSSSDDEKTPSCNHCGSTNLTPNGGKNVQKYHCNSCCTGTSDTAGTVWHNTKLPPEKREAIEQAHKKGLSCRKAAEKVGLNKDTINRAYQKLDGLKKPKPKNRFALFGMEDEEDE